MKHAWMRILVAFMVRQISATLDVGLKDESCHGVLSDVLIYLHGVRDLQGVFEGSLTNVDTKQSCERILTHLCLFDATICFISIVYSLKFVQLWRKMLEHKCLLARAIMRFVLAKR